MADIITPADLATHIYDENIQAIVRGNNTLVPKAIAAAIAEAKSYLSRYNIPALFDADNSAYISDENLANKIKDLASWHLVKLANPNINLELFRAGYEDAIKWFQSIQKGQANPYGWPPRVDNPDTSYPEGSDIQWTSNPKRHNHF